MVKHVVTIDFETYWDSSGYTLKKMGPIQYIRDPRFEVQLLGIRVDRGPVHVFEPNAIAPALAELGLGRDDILLVAHNGNGFDYLILSEHYGVQVQNTLDTMAAMRWTGISRVTGESHASLTSYLGNGVKKAGTAISDGKHWNQFTLAEQAAFKQYCADDVYQCSENVFKMLRYMTPDSILLSSLTARMATEPVFTLDEMALVAYLEDLDKRTREDMESLQSLFRFGTTEEFLAALRSARSFCAMLKELGGVIPTKFSKAQTLTNKTRLEHELNSLRISNSNPARELELERILRDPAAYAVYIPALAKTDLEFTDLLYHSDKRIALLVQMRLDHNSSIQRSRAERLLTLARTNKPMPVMLNVFKAHTSRFTAGNSDGETDGVQIQNLSKRDPKQLTLRRTIKVRPTHRVVVGDSSQVEARVLAWLANETSLVEQFQEKQDPYSILAEYIFNIPWSDIKLGAKTGDPVMEKYRQVGKTGILSAGFGVGWQKFSNTLLRSGAKLSDDLEEHTKLAYHAHSVYRATNKNIVAFWATCMQVVRHLEQGGEGYFGGPHGNTFHYGMFPILNGEKVPSIRMPSGFTLRYPGLTCELDEITGRPAYYYKRVYDRKQEKAKIYGGSVTENLTQGLAFQLLSWQACRMYEAAQLRAVTNNHDAWVAVVLECLAERAKAQMEFYMSSLPDWLPGLPVACEVKIGTDFTIA